MIKRPVVFLDRDGTIIDERGYLCDVRKMRFYPTAVQGLRQLYRHGFKLVVVTNQSAVGRGFVTREKLEDLHQHFRKYLKNKGVPLAGIYYCPHRPEAHCSCRKPKPGLIRRAVRELKLNLKRGYMIGDQNRDMQLAQVCQIKGILVLTGAGKSGSRTKATHISSNLVTASKWIINEDNKGVK